jgi:tetrathionate reductase subunit B
MKAFMIDVALCNGCYSCQIACKDEHVANDWSPIAKPQPDVGQFWLRLTEHIRGTVPKVKMHYVPRMCGHCREATCMSACPVEGAIYRRADGLVIIDPEKCSGCKACADACSYDAIFFNEDLNVAQKCTGCAHLLDGGEWKVPRCVDSCPTEAIKFGEEKDFAKEIAKAEVMQPESGCQPRAYYLNVPKKFVGGTVYDPAAEEVVIGATCTLKGKAGTQTTKTDDFGDFWFEGLADAKYSLDIAASGFKAKSFADVDTTAKDQNLGDIPLAK